MKQRILIVDDDSALRDLLSEYLAGAGYDVVAVADGAAMERERVHGHFDLIILDLMLPGDDGLKLCRELRARSGVAILMLTARTEEVDRVLGLEMGADDYMSKPFSPRELLARVRTILRRTSEGTGRVGSRLRFAGWTLQLATRSLVDADGVVVPLSARELRLLQMLAESPNRVLSRDELMDALAGRDAGPFDRTIDVMISRVRRRLRDDAREPKLIRTVRNEGYMLAAAVERVD
ncbi:MAG TPA: response regulator transcription factor [Burkholderiaceae bacterium]|nr:response regulator transcription factor [Burkholderiaceae bacterium]